MRKRTFCWIGISVSVWYALSLYTTHYTQLGTTLSGFAYRLYAALMQFLLPREAFGMVQLFILPTAFVLVCVAAHWSPFGLPLSEPAPAYLLAMSVLWFLICLIFLCRSARSKENA